MRLQDFGAAVLVALWAVGCSKAEDLDAPGSCGNGVCEASEGPSACPADCCGDGGCDPCADGGCGACGDSKLDPGEECDGTALGGATCESRGHSGGELLCSADCKLDESACCTDACTAAETRCTGEIVETCSPGQNGCNDWQTTVDCSTIGNFGCDATSGTAQCVATCTDQCTALGDGQCNGTAIESCQAGADGCLDWTQTSDCATSGQSCDASSGTPACVSTCVGQCPAAGATQCSGNVVQTCGAAGGGCLQWSTTVDCAASAQSCTVSGGAASCTSVCASPCPAAGQQTCLAGAIHTCTLVGGCLQWALTQSCASTPGFICQSAGTTASCVPLCSGDPCTTEGAKQCSTNTIRTCVKQPNTCLVWEVDTTCPLGQTCATSGGVPICAPAPPTGEDCGTAIQLVAGPNTVSWTATTNNYLTVKPSCISSYSVAGGDVVMYYQPTFTGAVELTLTKPTNNRPVLVATNVACGTTVPELACISDYAPTTMAGSFLVTAGTTYWVYAADTTNGTGTLPNPLSLQLTEYDCPTFQAGVTSVQPANGSTTTTLSPALVVNFDAGIQSNVGVVTISGNKGTNLSYDLSQTPFPTQVVLSNANKTLTVDPGFAFKSDELVTVTLSGFQDAICQKAITVPAWSFSTVNAPCSPGQGGMVGTTQTPLPLGLTLSSEYFVAVDADPSGWAYVGSTSSLYRVPKAGGTAENLNTLASVSSSQLGYSMVADGQSVFTVEYKTTGTNGHLWRITSDGGTLWSIQDFASFPSIPTAGLRAGAAYKGKVYLLTGNTSTTGAQQIWSVPVSPASVPAVAALESTFSGESYPAGLALDDQYFYLANGGATRISKVDRTSGLVQQIATVAGLNTTVNAIHAQDTNGDGTADVLYFKGNTREVWFTCDPAGATPFTDRLLKWGTGTSTYGLGYDPVANKLYAYNDVSPYGFIVIQ